MRLVAARAISDLVAGVDPSEVMVRQATRRNQAAFQAGRVDLRIGTIEKLPYPDGFFTKAFALHSLYLWPSVEGGVRELWRVLAHAICGDPHPSREIREQSAGRTR